MNQRICRSLLGIIAALLIVVSGAIAQTPTKKPADPVQSPGRTGEEKPTPPEAASKAGAKVTQPKQPKTNTGKPTVAEAEKWMADTEAMLNDLIVKLSRAQWVAANFITDDTEQISANENERF